MKQRSGVVFNIFITTFLMLLCFGAGLLVQTTFTTDSLLPSVFVLGAFLTSLLTNGYVYGVVFSLISMLAVNFAFTFPYFRLNFTIPENIVSAVIMLSVAVITCTLTTKLKKKNPSQYHKNQ